MVIVNAQELWKKYFKLNKISDLDSELIPSIIHARTNIGNEIGEAIGFLFEEIIGMTNFALLSEKNQNLILATNNGSLYYINDLENKLFIFASERYILQRLLIKNKLICL